jgi:hypothetical protein
VEQRTYFAASVSKRKFLGAKIAPGIDSAEIWRAAPPDYYLFVLSNFDSQIYKLILFLKISRQCVESERNVTSVLSRTQPKPKPKQNGSM